MTKSYDNINTETEFDDSEMHEHYKFNVDKGQSLLRIDRFLTAKIENASRNKVQNAAEAGCILVNGKTVKSNYKVKPEDEISVVMPYERRGVDLIAENIPLSIIYEDEDLIIINKPAGMVVHPGHGNYSGTLVNAIVYHLEQQGYKYDADSERGGLLVHRIDKDTSGIMVVAKNPIAHAKLAKQFFEHTTTRCYKALVWGKFDEAEGTIDGNIGRNLNDRIKMKVFEDGEHGKHAVTHYKVIEEFGYVTLVECRLETGRTHQIRVHMQHTGHPLFNDERYGGSAILRGTTFTKYKQFIHNCFQILPRQALHAASLGFIHPTTGKEMMFETELPADMLELTDKWRNYSINQ